MNSLQGIASGPDDPTPTTGAPYEPWYETDLPDGCRCHYREDLDWGTIRVSSPPGCPIHSCTCLELNGLHSLYCIHTALNNLNAVVTRDGDVFRVDTTGGTP